MQSTMLRKTIWALGAAILSVLCMAPVQATASGPMVFDVHLIRHGVFTNCGAFNVNFVADINAHYEQFFNDSGQLTLERRHVQFTGTLTNATSGASVPYEGNYIRTWDVSAGTITIVGERRKTEVPGEGVLAIAAGRLFINTTTGVISESGQTDENYNAAICRLLS